jgi:hypothetical protein
MVALKADCLADQRADEMDVRSDVLMALKKAVQKGQSMVVMTENLKKDNPMVR